MFMLKNNIVLSDFFKLKYQLVSAYKMQNKNQPGSILTSVKELHEMGLTF